MLDAGRWILVAKGIPFLIYPESSIEYPESLGIMQRDIFLTNGRDSG
jgi:hypothetical protein